jgi:uncharacterized protein YndB with AHSA1/START domain
MPHTVRVARIIEAPQATVWEALTDPARLRCWFADVERFGAGESFRFEFGDGDFFSGRTRQWVERTELRLIWRFMDVGPWFDIRYRLDALSDDSTRLWVVDRGAPLASEARSLRAGWTDFLARLDRAVTTGASTRFAWSPIIAASAFAHDAERPFAVWTDQWVSACFAGALVSRSGGSSTSLTLRFDEPAWDGHSTVARLAAHHVGEKTLITLSHDGWDRLPSASRLAERRRYAHKWAMALASLEVVAASLG